VVRTVHLGSTAVVPAFEEKNPKQIVPERQLGLSVWHVDPWIHDNGPYILIPVGLRQQLTKFLIIRRKGKGYNEWTCTT